MKTFYKIVKHTFDAIQYNGSNIKEVYDFINDNHGNANEISYEEFIEKCKRPEVIPLDTDGSTLCKNLMTDWQNKNKEAIEAYQKDRSYYVTDSDYFSKEALKERDYIKSLDNDWRKGEDYHIYLSNMDDNFCRLTGISKGDWFITNGPTVSAYSDLDFKNFIGSGWAEA